MADDDKPIRHPEYQKKPLTRREFWLRIGAVAGVGGAATLFATLRRDPDGHRSVPVERPMTLRDYRMEKPTGAPDVAIGRGDDARTRLRAALDVVGGLAHYVKPGDIVLVKPNVAFDRAPNLGATSNPEIVEELVRMLLVDCRAQEVRVADNPIESPADCFAKSGVRLAAERGGGRVYLPDSNAFRVLQTPNAKLIASWPIFQRPMTNVDKVIGIAPVKDHNLCEASMGIKNWYGLLGGRRNQFHQDIHEIVSDLALMMRPTLTILDGAHVLMKNGPTGGDPSNVKPGNTVAVGLDPVALDAWAFEHVLERGREYPRYLAMAEQKGCGTVDWSGRVGEART